MTTHTAPRGHTPSSIRRGPLPSGAYSSQPWRIHEIADDFDLEDVWALPVQGGADDFPRFVEALMNGDDRDFPAAYRLLFAVRWALGQALGTDKDEHGLGQRVEPLRDRLPDAMYRACRDDLRDHPAPERDSSPFRPLYLTDREYAAEIANRTMHGVLHIGWVEEPSVEEGSAHGRFSAQLSVLVRPNGLLGDAYMALIKPFRYLFVYPALLRTAGRRWDAATARSVA